MERSSVFLLHLSRIGCRNTSKLTAQLKGIYQAINILFGSVCIPLKINCKVLVLKGRATPGYRLSRNKPMEQQDLLASMTMDQDFPGKTSHCNTYMLYLAEAFKRKTLKCAD